MRTAVRKAVIPAAGLGTRFLPATKAQPKEMLPVVDKPAIQYVVEEAVRAGIDDILIITGRGKRSIEDHFDRTFELEYYLEKAGKLDELKEMQAIAEMADIHYVRQGEPLGLGHAVSVARQHVGDEPFVVLLGDDIMIDDVARARARCSTSTSATAGRCVALKEFARRGDLVLRLRAARGGRRRRWSASSTSSRSPGREDAPSNLAVMGRYVFTPEIFDALERVQPGRGRRDPAHRRHRRCCSRSRRSTATSFEDGRYDIGKKLDYLRATVELAIDRDDLGPEFRAFLADLVQRKKLV